MITAVIFDIGNVLVRVNLELWIESFKKMGIEKADQLFKDHELRRIIEGSYGVGKMSTEEFVTFVIQKSGCHSISFEAFRDAWNAVITELYEDALNTVAALRKQGLQVYTLSDTNELHFAYIEALYQKTHPDKKFTDLFNKCYLSHLTGHRKAQDEAWLEILREQKLLPEECLFIDDLEPNIERAEKLGLAVFHYQPTSTMVEVVSLLNPDKVERYRKRD